MREKYESLALAQLKELAKIRGIKGATAMKKADLVEAMLQEDEKDKALEKQQQEEAPAEENVVETSDTESKEEAL